MDNEQAAKESRKIADEHIKSLGEAIGACSEAIEECALVGDLGREDLERLNVARLALGIVLQRLQAKYGYRTYEPLWFKQARQQGGIAVPRMLLRYSWEESKRA